MINDSHKGNIRINVLPAHAGVFDGMCDGDTTPAKNEKKTTEKPGKKTETYKKERTKVLGAERDKQILYSE